MTGTRAQVPNAPPPGPHSLKLLEASSRDFILHFLRAYPTRTAAMVVLLLLSGIAEGLGLVTLLPLLDLAVGTGADDSSRLSLMIGSLLGTIGLRPTLGVLLSLIVVAIALKGVLLWLAMLQVGYTVAQVATDLRLGLMRALMSAEWAYFSRYPTGHFTNAISTEAHRATIAYREGTAALSGAIQILIYGAVVFLVSWQVALVAFVVGSVVVLLLRRFIRMGRAAGQAQTEVMKSLVARLTDAVPGIKPIKAMAREHQLLPLLEGEAEAFNEAQRRQVVATESLSALREPILVLIIAAGLYALLTLGNQALSAVLVMAVLFYRIMQTVGNVQSHYQGMVVGESALWSLQGHIDGAQASREVQDGSETPPPLEKGIELRGVTFDYGADPIIQGASVLFPAGSFIAVYGPSGSGKTTLVDLAVGLLRPKRGQVRVDGIPLDQLDTVAWRRMIGYVPQEVLLFHGSIIHNVSLGDESVSRAEVEAALTAAGAWEFVSSLPQGMDHFVGERGTQLSGGQRQRIAIARALIGGPRLLILDEATAGLDPATEREICRTLQGLGRHITIISISHQPAMSQAADLVFELSGGRVTERVGDDSRSLAGEQANSTRLAEA